MNTFRIHWLIEELQNKGVNEIMVTEFFHPNSQISKIEFLCSDEDIEKLKSIVHMLGTNGAASDHLVTVTEADTTSVFPFI